MARYFLRRLQIEGFRGINNEGDPLDLVFDTGSVNSVFAVNAHGKSSLFEALAYAIKGVVPKLERLPTSEDARSYYANRFHSGGNATVSLTLKPDDGSADIILTVTRDKASGNRSVTSPSGLAGPEAFLRSLDSDLALLDHDQFLEFVDDTPLKRGRTFSGLLGLAQLSEFRQILEALSNRRNLNGDLELDTLDGQKGREEREVRESEASIRSAFRGFFSRDPDPTLDIDAISADTTSALKSIPVVAAAIADAATLLDVSFGSVREAIKNAEGSAKHARLSEVLRHIDTLEAATPSTDEGGEREALAAALGRYLAALDNTNGAAFYEMYSAIQKLYAGGEWSKPSECPACNSELQSPLPEKIDGKLQQYSEAETALRAFHDQWRAAPLQKRMKELEESAALQVPPGERKHGEINRLLGGPKPSLNNLEGAVSHLVQLESKRTGRLGELREEKESLERELPPSLVALTQQVEYAASLQGAIKKNLRSSKAVRDIESKLLIRMAWAEFINLVSDQFAAAEVKLSTQKTTALDTDYREMYEQVTGNPEIVPILKKSGTSEELYLRLAKFYGLSDLSAATLLPESYRNALAICIYLAAVVHSSTPARFMVLDDVTSSFDAGHQWALMELIRTKIAYPENPNGPQVIILSHDGLLEKYFDIMDANAKWHHQRLQGMPPKGFVTSQKQDVQRLEKEARQQLAAGQTDLAMPLVRQCLEQKLLQIIRKLNIRVSIDFSIRDDRKMVGNCLDAISDEVDLHKRANDLILTQQQVDDLVKVHVPALIGNWVSHYATASGASFSPYVLLGVLDAINRLSDCFKYSCSCGGGPQPRFYKDLTSKACGC
jgi:DNA repair exonuclease SbcCD ATPase subunit